MFHFIFQAVDVVGQAGKPKTITGFQTHTTPVLLAYAERAELTTDEFLSQTPLMEGACFFSYYYFFIFYFYYYFFSGKLYTIQQLILH